MIITDIKPGRKGNILVYADGKYLLSVPREVFLKSSINRGSEITEKEIENITFEINSYKAKSRALNLLSYRAHSKKELEDKLRKDGYPERAIEEAVSYVESFHYIDDRAYVEQYLAGSGAKKGKKAVLYALAQKGVDRELVESVLEEQEDVRDEYELAKSAAFAKLGTPHRLDEKEYRRAAGFLMRKGFGSSEIRRALEEYQDSADEES